MNEEYSSLKVNEDKNYIKRKIPFELEFDKNFDQYYFENLAEKKKILRKLKKPKINDENESLLPIEENSN